MRAISLHTKKGDFWVEDDDAFAIMKAVVAEYELIEATIELTLMGDDISKLGVHAEGMFSPAYSFTFDGVYDINTKTLSKK